jgi:hypothetical protein
MGAIDADAHVIETVQTWSYLEGVNGVLRRS